MSKVERIAFAMFKSGYPPHIANEMKLGSLPTVQNSLGEGLIGELDIGFDWELNKASYMRMAAAALLEVNEIVAERQAP